MIEKEEIKSKQNSTYSYPMKRVKPDGEPLPSVTHISFKSSEMKLLLWEEELMDHYSMNRSDLHKHFIRTHYHLLKAPQVAWS
jgi:hypothetical protein